MKASFHSRNERFYTHPDKQYSQAKLILMRVYVRRKRVQSISQDVISSTTSKTLEHKKTKLSYQHSSERPLKQALLDLGQRDSVLQLCPQCGFLYIPCEAQQRKAHEKVCAKPEERIAKTDALINVPLQQLTLGEMVKKK